jgi:predicted ATPase
MTIHVKRVTLNHDKYPTKKHYPFVLPIFNQTKHLNLESPTTIFVGENGTGKSTLLEAIAHAADIHIWQDTGGRRYQVNFYEKELYKCISLDWSNGKTTGSFFGSEVFHDFTQILEEWAVSDPGQLNYWGGKSLITQSHGQGIMSYFKARYKIRGLYLLDEPETALSPKSQLEFLEIIKENSQAGHAQFIIATHSPILLACPGAKIFSFDHSPVSTISYEETQHYQIYKGFLTNPKNYLQD